MLRCLIFFNSCQYLKLQSKRQLEEQFIISYFIIKVLIYFTLKLQSQYFLQILIVWLVQGRVGHEYNKQIMENNLHVQDEIIIEKIQNPDQSVTYRKYLKGQLLGRGGFANCYEGLDLDSKIKVAVKVIEKSSLSKNRAKQKLLSEIKIHKMLVHPNVVKFLSVFQDIKRVYLIVELCENKALSDFVRRRKRLSLIQVKRFMLQLISAVDYLHSVKVIHRDLKMANIFLDADMSLKIGDLGLAAKLQFQQQRKRTMCGTPNYIAPEIIRGTAGHSYEVDIWSAGVICYAMFFGRPPFECSEMTKTYEKIKNAQFQFPAVEGVTSEFKDFISRILVVDPKQRLTIHQMKEHPFLKEKLPSISYNKITMTPVYDNREIIAKTISETNIFSEEKISKQKQPTASTIKQDNRQPMSDERQIVQNNKKQLKWNSESVVCYVDYSSKYGLGYILSNGNYGAYYNDSSLLYLSSKQNLFYYVEDPTLPEEKAAKYSERQLQAVASLSKKHALFKKFKVYLDDQLAQIKDGVTFDNTTDGKIYVRQWLKTKHAIMFRLSNKLFQVDFFDGSCVYLRTDQKVVLLKNKKGETRISSLHDAMSEKETETARRIKYIREILHKIKQR